MVNDSNLSNNQWSFSQRSRLLHNSSNFNNGQGHTFLFIQLNQRKMNCKKKSRIFLLQLLSHTTYSWNIKWKKCAGISVLWVLNEIFQKNILKIWKKSWEPFRSYLLNSTANPANFHPNWTGLAVLISRQLPNNSQGFLL